MKPAHRNPIDAGGTNGDDGTGDGVGNRTFTVANHEIVDYQGKHAMGRNSLGKTILQVGPFDALRSAAIHSPSRPRRPARAGRPAWRSRPASR